jgi:hypothetical protein
MIKSLVAIVFAINIGLAVMLYQQSQQQSAQRIVPDGNITLLTEHHEQLESQQASPTITEAPPPSNTPTSRGQHCYSYGPMANRLAAVGVLARLKETTHQLSIREVKPGTQYWAMLTLDTEQVTPGANLTQQLRDAGIKPADQLTHGELKGNLLLGIFSNQKKITQLAKRIKTRGATLRTEQKDTNTPSFWVDFITQDANFDPESLGLMAKDRHTVKRHRCKQQKE